ncbi:ribonuclease R [Verrucomicrobium sp. GAS474]|uniref:ribonuclease R n=1 Tax=Verrucomicrobium sp. GAS474 TaxID=1882831 RepID=UPI00087A24DF|nr:ribonuclease R [Verrucomicrobium sp. GAS474]SDT88820.1 ribonuclease R [Verrucomicrobium sp. GAS474]
MIEAAPLYALMRQSQYQPLDRKGLARKLKVRDEETAAFFALLDAEENGGRLVAVRNGLYCLPERLGLVAGRITVNERGFGFVVPHDPDHPDVYIGAEDIGVAMHHDQVLVRLNTPRGQKSGRNGGGGRKAGSEKLSGQVIRILQRARTQLVGTFERAKVAYYVRPDDSRIQHDIIVAPPRQKIPLGHKVVVKLKEWTSPKESPEGEITEVLGPPDQPGIDLLSIIRKFELPEEFPAAALAEADRIPDTVQESDLRDREDFRRDFVLTIDPDDAKDFDDALSYRLLPDNVLEVAIHIADVSHYVRPGSPLDIEARKRGNSVYLVDRVIPMLPEKLSNGLCSLRPNVDRLVKTVVVRLDPRGKVLGTRFVQGVIHSRMRFSYQEAYKLIKKPVGLMGKHLTVLGTMAQTLRKARFADGALNLEFTEVKVRLDEKGKPVRLEKVENDASHQLIEEFMLLANELVAKELRRANRPALYRVHENPEPARLNDFRAQVLTLGIQVGDLTLRGEIQKLLNRIAGKAEEPVIKTNLLKSMKRAVYSEQPLGHFGLAKKNYAHFTSPIRRYADLAIHRALFGKPQPLPPGLADALSATERTASDAEKESVILKKLEFFSLRAQASTKEVFPALVLEVRSGGLLVELPDFLVTGFVRISEMQGDFYDFDAARQELRGEKSKAKVRTGMRIGVHVVNVDLGRRLVDFGTTKQKLLTPPGKVG